MDNALRDWFNEAKQVSCETDWTKHDTSYNSEVYGLDDHFPAPVIEGTTHILLNIGRSYSWGPDWDCASWACVKAVEEVVTVTKVSYVPV